MFSRTQGLEEFEASPKGEAVLWISLKASSVWCIGDEELGGGGELMIPGSCWVLAWGLQRRSLWPARVLTTPPPAPRHHDLLLLIHSRFLALKWSLLPTATAATREIIPDPWVLKWLLGYSLIRLHVWNHSITTTWIMGGFSLSPPRRCWWWWRMNQHHMWWSTSRKTLMGPSNLLTGRCQLETS